MAAGDRILNPDNDGYAVYEVTDESVANGRKQAALLVKQVDDAGATVTPGATTVADGADATQGAKADSAATTDTGTFSIVAFWKRLMQKLTAGIVAAAGENHIGAVGGHTARVSATFARPADTNVYASGDLVANSTTAGSVVPMSFAIGRDALGKGGMLRRVRLRKSGTSVINASFRLHLYSSSPTVTNGDNGVWLSNGVSNYVGAFDISVDKAFSDGAAGNGSPLVGSEINFTADTYYGLLEARGAYTPASAETFEVLLEALQN